ncbi:hypothetical protein PAMP_008495 [Pampus punctatissimus]
MLPTFPFFFLFLLLAGPALLTTSVSQELQVRGQRTPRDTKQDSIKVVISEGCTTQGESSDGSQGGKEIDMVPGSPLVLTHKIKLIPSVSGSGSCGCETDFAALQERLERLEREVSVLREKCGGPEGGCCTSKESKGAGCSIKPDIDECPNECSDQGRCVEGKCVCFSGFSGVDCSNSNCPGNCNNNGRCVNGQCVCDPGFTGTDCSQSHCPDNCNNRGRCVKGKCVCNSGFTGPSCSDESCPGNCNKRGRCINGQCVCNPGFIGPDCSKRACPNNCNNHGRCVNGKCVCDSGFIGADCSEISCPGNCNNRGRCINGQCVCDDGFTGLDCSDISCPGNCNNRGRCINGQCVCDDGFTGLDCSDISCPGNCNNRGRCVNGECVCDGGFTGSDCSERTCPNDCNNRGRCVNGKCVCDNSFTGEDCSDISCPGNCNNRGRCVNGQCVCNDGFTGQDCFEKACPNNCSNHGKCVNGNCVCNVGFAGPECAAKGCPNNCNNKGRCVKGRCICRRGFTGPDCSQCEKGMTGPNCDAVMSGVSQLSTREITETSVTLVWTPPPVHYETYHITFTSQKDSDQQITVQVPGSLTTFTQTGLAAGQEYTVNITGEIDGRRGAKSSTKFTTLISGPKNLQVVKTTSTTAVVQWEPSQGEIDRYHMTVSPSDGAGRSQGISIPSGRNSAHIQQLEAGRLYDIILVAEKGTSRSEPATTQTVPGNTFPMVTMASVTTQVTPEPGQEVGNRDQEFNPLPEKQAFDQQEGKEDGSHGDSVKVGGVLGLNQEPSATVIAKTKPLGIHLRRPLPNMRPFHNQTRPNLRVGTRLPQLLIPSTKSSTESISSTESQDSSSPSSPKEKFYPAEGTAPGVEDPEGRVGANLPTEFNRMRDNLNNSSDHPTSKVSPHPYVGPFQNRTRINLRPPQPPHRSSLREVPTRNLNGSSGITRGSLTIQREKENTPEILDNQSGEQGDHNPIQEVQIRHSGGQDTAGIIHLGGHESIVRPQTNQLEKRDNDPTQTIKSREEETQTPESNSDSDIHKKRVIATKNTGIAIHRPIMKQTSSNPKTSRPVIFSKRRSSIRRITGQSHTQMRNISGNQMGEDPKTNQTAKPEFYSNTEQTRSGGSKSPTQSDVSSSGVTREPLSYVGVTNQTSDRFTVIWDAPEAKYKNFVVTMKETGNNKELKEKESRKKWEEDTKNEYSKEDKERLNKPTKEAEAEHGNAEDENRLLESVSTQIPTIQSIKPATESDKTFKKVVPGSARSFQFEDLPPQTEYTVTLLGKSPGLLSRLHKLIISTGPEPPSNIVFSELTENSLTVSWTKPKRPVSGFKVTYTHNKEDEPVSVSVDSNNSSLSLSKLTPGSSYTVSVISILGLDESDPIKDLVMTLPDPPKELQAVNITDTKALLLWRPALAAIEKYTIVYGSGNGPAVRIAVSGNTAEQQLSGLEGSTTYTVTITSELGSLKSSEATTSFTTTSGSERDRDGPGDLQVSQVTPRTALLSWKPPSKPVGRYRLTYQTEGQDMKEVIVDATGTEYNLTKLHPGSKYTVQLQVEGGGGRYIPAISTDFTTGTLQFPYPTDCSQELLNGIRTSGEVEIFPQGKLGTPLMVYCDMETDGGGWTVFQRRKDGSVDFFRGWNDYAKGFGDLSGEFWLGLDSLHSLTSVTRMSLRVDLRDGDTSVFAQYSTFEVAKRNYRLTVGGYSGTAGDSLSYHNNGVFSTKDRDRAPFITRCAMSYRGGWWYKNCHNANLNGLYGIDVKHQGLIWTTWKGKEFSVPFTEMKMRPAAFSPPTRG